MCLSASGGGARSTSLLTAATCPCSERTQRELGAQRSVVKFWTAALGWMQWIVSHSDGNGGDDVVDNMKRRASGTGSRWHSDRHARSWRTIHDTAVPTKNVSARAGRASRASGLALAHGNLQLAHRALMQPCPRLAMHSLACESSTLVWQSVCLSLSECVQLQAPSSSHGGVCLEYRTVPVSLEC